MMMDLINQFQAMTVTQLREVLSVIGNVINEKLNKQPNEDVATQNNAANINDYVIYSSDFLSDIDNKLLRAEMASLQLGSGKSPQNKSKISTAFISSVEEPYIWESQSGPIRNEALKMNDYPVIKSVLEKVNAHMGSDLNCCLVSRQPSGSAAIRLHDDNEVNMDQTEPICVISLGTKRKIEFVNQHQKGYKHTVLSLEPKENSMYVMKPGCQSLFSHRVRKDHKIKDERISLSFRRFVSPKQDSGDPTNTPVKNLIAAFENSKQSDQYDVDPSHCTTAFQINVPAPFPNSHHNSSATQQGYSPFPPTNIVANVLTNGSVNEKVCLIFGTSITEGVDDQRMSKGSTRVINMSASGNKIDDITQSVRDFTHDNPGVSGSVFKIVFSFGTNDIKFFNSFKYDVKSKFRKPIVQLVDSTKMLYPNAQIIFQSVLPFRLVYKYQPLSVHEFNHLLLEICGEKGCLFMDCFADYLDELGEDINLDLFRDRWHLNDRGLAKLCKSLKFIIYENIFNPYLSKSLSDYYYLESR
jgi:alkylated DNA repair dioxygenase AlkB